MRAIDCAVVKCFAIIAVVLIPLFSAKGDSSSWQGLSAQLFTNTAIVWQANTSQLPNSLWIYHRRLPHVFSATIISNAVVLGSLQDRGFPRSSTNNVSILEQVPPNWPGIIPVVLGIQPGDAYLYFSIPHYGPVSKKEISDDDALIKRAQGYASQFGLDSTKLTRQRIFTHSCDTDQTANDFCGRGVFFPRYLDGISFFSAADDGESAEGFSMEFGEHDKIQAFSVRWSDVEHYKNERLASLDEMTRCIRGHKAIVLPNFKEDDFARLRKLATATKLTVTEIMPFYGEGMFGSAPANDVPPEFVTPFAELEAMAELNNTNITIRLLCPILADEAKRLLETKNR
jgi:hypothetical protein